MDFAKVPLDQLIRVRGESSLGSLDQTTSPHTFKFQNSKTEYYGGTENGSFHGKGTLVFENGGKFEAVWENGIAVRDGKYTFPDGLDYDEDNWDYCTGLDRRFYVERRNGLKSAGRSNFVDKEVAGVSGFVHKIPENSFDTADGYYLADERRVYTYSGEFLRVADDDEHEFTLKYCRKGADGFVGDKTKWRMNQPKQPSKIL